MASTDPTASRRDETLVQPVVADRPTGRHTAPPTAGEAVAAQRATFGGLSWGAAFFGWLSANGLAVLLISLLGAAGGQPPAFWQVSEDGRWMTGQVLNTEGGFARWRPPSP